MSEKDGTTLSQGDQGQPQAPATDEQSQDVAGASSEQGGQEESQPEYITRADAEAMVREVENRARSYADKGRVRAEKAAQEAKDMVQRMRDLGQDISDADADKLIQAAKVKAIEAPDAESDTPEGPTPAQVEELQYFVEQGLGNYALRMQGKYDVRELDAGDPELKNFKMTGDPEKDKANLEQMYKSLAERLSGNPADGGEPQSNETPPDEAGVRVPAGSGSAPIKKRSTKAKLSEGLSGGWNKAPAEEKGG